MRTSDFDHDLPISFIAQTPVEPRELAGYNTKEVTMVTLDALKNVRFVVDASGKQSAVQVSMEDWQKTLEYLAELEDRERIKAILHCLKAGPEKSNALNWKEVRRKW